MGIVGAVVGEVGEAEAEDGEVGGELGIGAVEEDIFLD